MAHFEDRDTSQKFQGRLSTASVVMLIAFFILVLRFFWLGVVQNGYYTTRAEDNRLTLVPVVPNRGLIFDRNGVLMATNTSAYTLEIVPGRAGPIDETIENLSKVVTIEGKDKRRFKQLLREAKTFESIPIRSRLTEEEVARFAAQRYRFPGVEVRARLFRSYPLGETAAHALGYMGRINNKDLERIDEEGQAANYRGTDHIGKSGLEQRYEFEMHGVSGFESVEVDAGGRGIRVLSRTPPVSGNNLNLTIDAKLQQVAETAFGKRRGALVAIDPANGEILALVSMPTYDPNLFVDGIRSDDWDTLNTDINKPLLNRAIYGTYPPGSTFKPFMALGALATGKRTPQQAISDPGYFNFGNHTFRDDKKGGHGMVNMYSSIVHSCDTYYYTLANDWGIDGIAGFMGQLGLGSKTGIDIDGESRGILPSQEWKQRRFKRPEQQKWYAGETISIGIGQGYNSYTMMQLAQATAILANNGVGYKPHLVRSITDARSGGVREIPLEKTHEVALKPEHVEVIKNAMIGVNKEGTGTKAFAGAKYVAAGKTGTAQVFSLNGGTYSHGGTKEFLRDHALFIAFAPADKPKIALAVIVENAGFGATSAAPITRQVFDYYLQGIVPKGPAPDEPGEPAPEQRDMANLVDHQDDDYDAQRALNAPTPGPFVRMPSTANPALPVRKKP
ncbi:MAG: penicillin-binding protein 2 [Rhodocyclaceae bacterium]|jgi:penicillin-binding protein 2|uniref:Peptidoglycan D,D-transpeptidase MrdA n=1 Tax=Fluviibacter phosphoraccumulans TaxID=1751046 RepID=A0A679I8A0_9RHOO|nr:penicillin-binding protein 2 [Fluviibacter phosphoraccumulans]MBP7917960.1 penicillin-binding protein 2 [Rhodocyclaceae bacterium]BBU68330.1 penicillin-binding protein [Fluviibacter phosphoraccumulans]BBU70131.1 penicillin-binding protein [Fluviibacter phosphoraccumulans]BCA66513.1 penicillin-binding protein [Fluviibacter phosphoraccumulans]